MRKRKEPTVELIVPKYGTCKSFGIEHAERLLDMGENLNGGWTLPSDSDYQYSEESGLKLRTDKGNTAKTE